jgi:predicted TIM-barrel fold metal-dependent hydrolase
LELALFPNVFVKVSDVHDHSGEDLSYRDIHPFVRQVQDAFGTDRLMWGTGYPGTQRVKNGWPTLADELRLVREGYDWLTAAEKARLLGGTAEAVWGL